MDLKFSPNAIESIEIKNLKPYEKNARGCRSLGRYDVQEWIDKAVEDD